MPPTPPNAYLARYKHIQCRTFRPFSQTTTLLKQIKIQEIKKVYVSENLLRQWSELVYPFQLLLKCYMQYLKPWEKQTKRKNHIKLGVSLFMKLALFERAFCNGNKEMALDHKSSDPAGICVRKRRSWSDSVCVAEDLNSNTNQDPDVNVWNMFKFHECLFSFLHVISIFFPTFGYPVGFVDTTPLSKKKKVKENKETFVKRWRWKAVEFPAFETRPTSKFSHTLAVFRVCVN